MGKHVNFFCKGTAVYTSNLLLQCATYGGYKYKTSCTSTDANIIDKAQAIKSVKLVRNVNHLQLRVNI